MTTYYVDPAAGGANNGTSWTDAWTSLQTAADTAVATDIVYCRGTQTLAASIDFDTNSGTNAAGWIKFIGCNSSGNVDGTRFILDGNNGSYHVINLTTVAMVWFENIEVKNSAANYSGFYIGTNASSSGHFFINCCANGCQYGYYLYYGRGCHLFRCVAYSNDSHGFYYVDNGNFHYFCCSRDNSGSGYYVNGAYGALFYGCVSHGNTDDGFYLGGTNTFNKSVINCVCDANTDDGFVVPAGTIAASIMILGCRITNHSGAGDIGLNAGDEPVITAFNYFEDNDGNNIQNTTVHQFIPLEGGSTTSNQEDLANTNEGYVDKTNHDFSTNYVDSGDPDLRRTAITIPWT